MARPWYPLGRLVISAANSTRALAPEEMLARARKLNSRSHGVCGTGPGLESAPTRRIRLPCHRMDAID